MEINIKETYIRRRETLKKKFNKGVIFIKGNEPASIDTFANHYPFRQDSNFLYYTGINLPSVSLIIDITENREIFFADDSGIEDQIWTGPVEPFSRIAGNSGISEVKPVSQLKPVIDKILKDKTELHFFPVCQGRTLIKMAEILNIPVTSVNSRASVQLIETAIKQREVKSEEEIKEIESALDISHQIYLELMQTIRPGLSERKLLAVINSILTEKNAMASFPTILTKYGQYLHNMNCSNVIKENDLLLIDSGVFSNNGYSSDITRTLPVSGKYTEIQKTIYNLVLETQLKSLEIIKPGIFFRDIHLNACKIIISGLKDAGIMCGNTEDAVGAGAHALFMPHGLGHMLGIDAHDMELLGEDKVGYDSEIKRSKQFGLGGLRLAKKLKPGHVLTVEPGIYFIPGMIINWRNENKFKEFINYEKLNEYLGFGGIRIEDDVQVIPQGGKVLGKRIPKTVEEIEEIMN
ncbi:MAG: aminopeptidase P N-terminal domain-containing protein [Victivallales bacterium]|nr:aminopeptidase P N-terminal domain-containing protein [Victivallales bacterium]